MIKPSGSKWLPFLAGGFSTIVLLVAAVVLYLRFGSPPVAVHDRPFPFEAQIVHVPLNARIAREMSSPPFQANAADMIAGAQIYIGQCASCHGTPNHRSELSTAEYPPPPQLWERNHHGGIGVDDDQPGQVFWKVKNGIRLTGMPAFDRILTERQQWQVSLLVQSAGHAPPAEAIKTLAQR